MNPIRLVILACVGLLGLAPTAPAQKPKDALYRDQITLTDGKVYDGRLYRRYDPEEVVLYRKSKPKKFKRKHIAAIHTLRDDLDQFLLGHSPGLTLQEEWDRVQEALDLNLPSMAIVQAWRVLGRDNNHEGANQFLGHKAVRGEYRWQFKTHKKKYQPKEMERLVKTWSKRFVLESPHYRVETDTSINQAVNMIFDLELTYIYWMDNYAELLQTGEQVTEESFQMTWYVYNNKNDKGFSTPLDQDREAFFNPERASEKGVKRNLVHSYYTKANQERPEGFFDLAIRQLMFSTMVLSKRGLGFPGGEMMRPHWVELGMGHWLGRQLGGAPGHARHQRFSVDTETQVLAQRQLVSGPLSKSHRSREVKDLVGLHRSYFEDSTKDNRNYIYRAKARSLFRFIMEEDPALAARGKQSLSSRDALITFLREIYPQEKGPTSKALDKAMSGRLDALYAPWIEWRK